MEGGEGGGRAYHQMFISDFCAECFLGTFCLVKMAILFLILPHFSQFSVNIALYITYLKTLFFICLVFLWYIFMI